MSSLLFCGLFGRWRDGSGVDRNLDLYCSVDGAVLIAVQSSIGCYYQPVLIHLPFYIGCSAWLGRWSILFPWVSPFFARSDMAGGGEAFVLCTYLSV